jgi:hypothetical protein
MSTSRTREKADGELFKSTGIDDNATSTAITIDASENVGIGTSSPSALIDAVTNTNDYVAKFIQSNTSNGDGVQIIVGSTASADYALTVRSDAGNTSGLAVKADGKVGIGTFVPSKPLDVSGDIRTSTGILFGTDTAAANTLSDYETGSWTPSGTGINTGTSKGYYTKVGNVCHLQMWVHANGNTDGTISGLPFTAGHTNSAIAAGTIAFQNGSVTGILSAGQNTSISLYNGTATGSMASGNQMHCAMTYRTT